MLRIEMDPKSKIYRIFNEQGELIAQAKEDNGQYTLFDASVTYLRIGDNRICTFPNMISLRFELEKHMMNHTLTAKSARCTNGRFLPNTDQQFYPTPSWLAGKMIGKINWAGVKNVLEPSAGKGDILDYLLQTRITKHRRNQIPYSYRLKDQIRLDAIEIDPDLRHILKDKEYHVVGDDFLAFSSAKAYDAILMNPPFLHGAEHLNKAIRLMRRGGQIVCLLNAETITNPFSRERQDLKKYLHRYKANVEFIDDGFKKAERQANVRLAIVSMIIPKPEEKESEIWTKLKKAQEKQFQDESKNELTTGSFLDQAILHYQMETNAAYSFFKEYNSLSGNLMKSFETNEHSVPLICLSIDGNTIKGKVNTEDWNDFVKALRMKYWNGLLQRPEITRLMTSDIQKTYQAKVSELASYEFSKFNIQQIMDELTLSMKDGVEASIEKLFDDLSGRYSWREESLNTIHYYNGWATNKAWKVSMKAILPINGYNASLWGNSVLDTWKINGKISALERALAYIDYGTTAGMLAKLDISSATEYAKINGKKTINYTYFSATFHKKGTCHIKFYPETEKLIDRLNIFIGKKRNWLPPSYGKKHYKDMDEAEKAVVREFQGEASYEAMMVNPSDYIPEIGTSALRIEAA